MCFDFSMVEIPIVITLVGTLSMELNIREASLRELLSIKTRRVVVLALEPGPLKPILQAYPTPNNI